jgi:hypothetical protein
MRGTAGPFGLTENLGESRCEDHCFLSLPGEEVNWSPTWPLRFKERRASRPPTKNDGGL